MWLDSLGSWRSIAESAMRPDLVVLLPPVLWTSAVDHMHSMLNLMLLRFFISLEKGAVSERKQERPRRTEEGWQDNCIKGEQGKKRAMDLPQSTGEVPETSYSLDFSRMPICNYLRKYRDLGNFCKRPDLPENRSSMKRNRRKQ